VAPVGISQSLNSELTIPPLVRFSITIVFIRASSGSSWSTKGTTSYSIMQPKASKSVAQQDQEEEEEKKQQEQEDHIEQVSLVIASELNQF
jgi:hypothetical protein